MQRSWNKISWSLENCSKAEIQDRIFTDQEFKRRPWFHLVHDYLARRKFGEPQLGACFEITCEDYKPLEVPFLERLISPTTLTYQAYLVGFCGTRILHALYPTIKRTYGLDDPVVREYGVVPGAAVVHDCAQCFTRGIKVKSYNAYLVGITGLVCLGEDTYLASGCRSLTTADQVGCAKHGLTTKFRNEHVAADFVRRVRAMMSAVQCSD